MGNQEYERIRAEVHKKYKDQLSELRSEVSRWMAAYREMTIQNEQLKRKIQRLESEQPTSLVDVMRKTFKGLYG